MADNETFDFDSFDFGEFDNLDTGVNVQRQPVVTPDVSHIVTSLKKRAMVVIFVVDISGSMKGARIGAVNDAIRNVLPELKKNKWFRYSTRVGIAIEEGALSPECRRVLTEFTDNEKNVYEAKNTVVLARQIRLVTLTGVDTVTHQGSVQNAAPPQTPASKSHADRSDRFDLGTPPPIGMSSGAPAPAAPETASPTLPIDEIDWDNDFYF